MPVVRGTSANSTPRTHRVHSYVPRKEHGSRWFPPSLRRWGCVTRTDGRHGREDLLSHQPMHLQRRGRAASPAAAD